MNVSVHAAAGALIAIVFKQPVVALPLAFASHFVLDGFPHFGYKGHGGFEEAYRHRLTYFVIAWEVIALAILLYILRGQPFWIYLAGFFAFSPDLVWLYRHYGFEKKGLEPPKVSFLSEFHSKLQWCERPWGIIIELTVFGLLVSTLKEVL